MHNALVRSMTSPYREILHNDPGSWSDLVIQGRGGMMAPREQKGALSKILVNSRQTERPCCHRQTHYLAFTKMGQEPALLCKAIRGANLHSGYHLR